MRSDESSDGLDLARDLPTDAADVRALRRARTAYVPDAEAYVRFLSSHPPVDPANLSARIPHRALPPFELPD